MLSDNDFDEMYQTLHEDAMHHCLWNNSPRSVFDFINTRLQSYVYEGFLHEGDRRKLLAKFHEDPYILSLWQLGALSEESKAKFQKSVVQMNVKPEKKQMNVKPEKNLDGI